ncbi:uncharacterized protein LOC106082052 [Stomoxys calcitrans]|uniref:uncharacterized protein LOC106082052 n=1 Tax=Stomoxys calcitrans TaxID=35570 RepID=UPI0027E38E11|nr:uncharacterized protein LOC106082052 [Stomoxys calcitrans]
MAPAQILDIPQTRYNYTHKKFQGSRYAHKKFGTRTPSPPIIQLPLEQNTSVKQTSEKEVNIKTSSALAPPRHNTKATTNDIFRPYALGEHTSSKRKHHDMHPEDQSPNTNGVNKRFAYTTTVYQSAAPPPSTQSYTLPFAPTFLPLPPPPSYSMQQYHFNPQTFALMLQKQQAALCMGEILKRQTNFYPYNIVGK